MKVERKRTTKIQFRPRRPKIEKNKLGLPENTLELDGVFDVLKNYDGGNGGTNCSVCGKLYKSRVCLIKHVWEHTIYWDMFKGQRNQDRVLSIQAALILYGGSLMANNIPDSVSSLLVTSPQLKDDKQKETGDSDGERTSTNLSKSISLTKQKSPCKLKTVCAKTLQRESDLNSGILITNPLACCDSC